MVDAEFGRAYPREKRLAAFQELEERVSRQPGVISVAQVGMTPMSGSGWNESLRPDSSNEPAKMSFFNRCGPGYLKTMGVGLIAGRDFDDRDNAAAPQVAIVNEAFAKTFYNSGNPVGHIFRVEGNAGQPDRVYEVVGLIRNTKYYELREDFLPIAFFPIAQDKRPGSDTTLMIRTSGAPRDLFAAVKGAAAAVNPQVVLEFHVMSAQIGDTLLRDRLMATLAGAFGALAALLAAIGLYGVIAYMVARRQNEIGVRMALGADAGSVVRLVLREAMMLLAAGLVIGTALALWAGKAAEKMLFGLKPNDATTFVAAAVLLALAALAAGYIPARRASRLDPMHALRME
jgi:predicted permease